MRIIKYFLIGLFFSLFTVPLYADVCIPGFSYNVDTNKCLFLDYSYDLMQTGIYDYNHVGEINPSSEFGIYLIGLTAQSLPVGTARLNFYLSKAAGSDVGVFDIEYQYDNYDGVVVGDKVYRYGTDQEVTNISEVWSLFLSGGFVDSIAGLPEALFNIDGIKENILATLLLIVGFLLTIFSLKYALRFVWKELLSGGSDGYVTSIEIGKDGLTRDTYYSPDGKVERISYSNENAGNEEQDSHKFATGYSEDWDKTLEVSHKEHFEDVTGFPSKASSDDWIDLSGSSPERAALAAEYFDAVRDGYVSPDLCHRVSVAYNIK